MFYVTRDNDGAYYVLWSNKPNWNKKEWVNYEYGIIDTFPPYLFEKLTDIKLEGGRKSILKIDGFKAILSEK